MRRRGRFLVCVRREQYKMFVGGKVGRCELLSEEVHVLEVCKISRYPG